MTLTRKASQAGAVMLVGIIMQMSGFVSGQSTQPEAVSHTILLILSCGTLLVLACGFLVSLRFKLNLQTHSTLREETVKCANPVAQCRKVLPHRHAPPSRCLPGCRMNHFGVTTILVT